MNLTRQQKTRANLELEHGRSSEMLILSSCIAENCVTESNHETMLITWPPLLLLTLHAEHSVGVQPKVIYGHIFALALMLAMFLPTFVSVLIGLSLAMVTRTSYGFLDYISLRAIWHYSSFPVCTGNFFPLYTRI